MEEYKTVELEACDEFVEKKSRFIGYVCPVKTQSEAGDFINKIRNKHKDATHNVPAYVLRENNIYHSSDDGEPSSTAGAPVLDVILKSNVCDVCVVVTRYFGGVLLGTGGLVRAYSKACSLALSAGHIITMAECDLLRLTVEYSFYERLIVLLKSFGADIIKSEFKDVVEIDFSVKANRTSDFTAKLTQLSNGKYLPVNIGHKFSKTSE